VNTAPSNATAPSQPKFSGWKAIFPPSQWIPSYEAGWLRYDLFAGITLRAYAIPEGVAYATLAGLPPQVGIYGYLLGGLGHALFGSSRHLAIGPTSAISLMVGASVAHRIESPIVYFNVDNVLRIVLDYVEAEAESLRLVVCDLSTSPTVDSAGAKMLLELCDEPAKRRLTLRLVEASASVRDMLRIEGAEDRVGRIDRFETVNEVVEHFQKEGVPAAAHDHQSPIRRISRVHE
jgi:MFS superfamily sulfate permease-like transporter